MAEILTFRSCHHVGDRRYSIELVGFTLVEVLIALAITAFVSTVAYSSLSTAIIGVERTREVASRSAEINRAWVIISRDLRQFAKRPVRDEFGGRESAMTGGPAARFDLSFTRGGWHNPNQRPRSNLQRVNYRLEEQALWRDVYQVLDRAANSEPDELLLLEEVESFEVVFLASLAQVDTHGDGLALDTRNWSRNWIAANADATAVIPAPLAVELRLRLTDLGEMRRLYVLPPL